MSTPLVIIHEVDQLTSASLSTITAGLAIAPSLSVLVMGSDIGSVAREVAQVAGVTAVLTAADSALANPTAEQVSSIVEPVAAQYSHLLMPANTFGKNCMPRLAAKLSVGQISDISAVQSADTFERPIYAGNAVQVVQNTAPIHCLTVRTTAFGTKHEIQATPAEVSELIVSDLPQSSQWLSLEASESTRPELTSAKVVVSGGRGLQNKENFAMIEQFADKLGAAVGASRAAVDAGFVPNDYQVGQTGKVVAPDLYFAIGISGAIQHIAGMKDAKIVVAINKDPEAPIFQVADYGLVGDLFDILPKLEDALAPHLS